MAIRVRKVNGRVIAICAAKSSAKPNDLYLDDRTHEALGDKFGLDLHAMGFTDKLHMVRGEEIIDLMKSEEKTE